MLVCLCAYQDYNSFLIFVAKRWSIPERNCIVLNSPYTPKVKDEKGIILCWVGVLCGWVCCVWVGQISTHALA